MDGASEIERLRRENDAMQARLRALESIVLQQPQQPPPNQHQHAVAVPTAPQPQSSSARDEECTQQLVDCFEESPWLANHSACTVLEAIATNILRFPREPKYRRLKTDNARLKADLFSNTGSFRCLSLVGFQPDRPQAAASEPDDVPAAFTLPETLGEERRLQCAIEAAVRVKQRDELAQRSRIDLEKYRRTLGHELRMDAFRKVAEAGGADPNELHRFVLGQLQRNDLGTSMELHRWLRLIISNVQDHPEDPKYRALRSSNPVLRRTILPAFGSIELLVGVVGFVEQPDGYVLPAASFEGQSYEATMAKLRAARNLLDEAECAVQCREQEERAALRDVARSELLRAREEEKKAMWKSQSNSSHDDKPAAAVAGAVPSGRRRVPLQEAIAVLMGKANDDE